MARGKVGASCPLALLLPLLLVLQAASMGSGGASDPASLQGGAEDVPSLTIEVRTALGNGGPADLRIVEVRAEAGACEGPFRIGLSTGNAAEPAIDPTPGAPMLPWIATVIDVQSDIASVEAVVSDVRTVMMSGPVGTVPPPSLPWERPGAIAPWDPESVYPSERVRLSPLGYRHIDGELYRSYSLWASPFYLSSTLEYGPDMTLRIVMSDGMTGPSDKSWAEGDPYLVPNTVSATPYMELPPEYIIITSDDLRDELSPLADRRSMMGVPTSVVTVEDIVSTYSGSSDPADLIRTYLRDVLYEWGSLRYVMLAGDWTKVPVKRVVDSDPYYPWDDGYIPADSYFQCLDGTWDLDGDGLYGEVGDLEDLIPDISVSRLAIDSPEQWTAKLSQIEGYEAGTTDTSWSGQAVLIAANTHNPGDGTEQSEYLWSKYLASTYPSRSTLYEDQGTLSLSAIDSDLEDGATFVQFVDHGGPTVWCDDYGRGVVYRDWDASRLTNDDMLPMVSTLACLTTWFDDTSGCGAQSFEECLGEAFTENTAGGAVGYMGSSRTSVGILGADMYLPYDNGLQEDVARQVGELKVFRAGDTFTGAKTHYSEVWGGQFTNPNNPEVSLCWLEFTLLGEPTVDLWTGRMTELLTTVDHENDLDPHIAVSVTDMNGVPASDANVTLQNFERGIFEKGETDPSGFVSFDLALDRFCDLNLTVTKHDHIPFKGTVRISDLIPPKTQMTLEPELPDGKNGWYLSEPAVTFAMNEAGTVHCRLGTGATFELNSSTGFALPPLGEGEHALHYFGVDIAGNLEEERHVTIKVDLNDPMVSCSIVPSEPNGGSGYYTTEPLLTLKCVDEGSGSPTAIICSIDGEEFEYAEPFFVPEGDHEVSMRPEDLSGRVGEPTVLFLMVDTTAPETETAISPARPNGKDGWYTTSPTVTLSSNEPSSRIEFRTSSAVPFTPYSDPLSFGDGTFTLHFRSVDPSGNIEAVRSLELKVDTTLPEVEWSVAPDGPDGLNGAYVTTPVMTFGILGEGEGSVMMKLDSGAWTVAPGTLTVPEGEHDIEFYAVDQAGLESMRTSLSFTVDTVGPKTTADVEGTLRDGRYITQPRITLYTDEEAALFYRFGGGQVQEYDSPFEPPGREGTYLLHYFGRDLAGNEEGDNSLTLLVDSKGPDIAAFCKDLGGGELLIDATGTTDGTSLQFRFSVDGKVVRDWSAVPTANVQVDGGSHDVVVEARDEGGNIARRAMTVESGSGPGTALIAISVLILVILIIGAVAAVVHLSRARSGAHAAHAAQPNEGRGAETPVLDLTPVEEVKVEAVEL